MKIVKTIDATAFLIVVSAILFLTVTAFQGAAISFAHLFVASPIVFFVLASGCVWSWLRRHSHD
jgi:hypothetical protein